MRYQLLVTLEYRGKKILEDGSPEIVSIQRYVQGYVEEQFSQYYYRENQRNMRKSKNVSIPVLAQDIQENGIKYELVYVYILGIKYQIKEILKHRSSNRLMLLDCEEVTQ